MIKFLKINEPYGCFSNFSRHDVKTADGKVWPRSEHLYQALKFNDVNVQEGIRSISNPKEAKEYGYKFEDKLRLEWEDVKYGTMLYVCRLKLLQHNDIMDCLRSTGNQIIVENSKYDSTWGCGPDGKGLNLLGKVWMELRNEIK
jgi:ribA/ribD-fused uncharacterized protein